jgi:hypothetical protein
VKFEDFDEQDQQALNECLILNPNREVVASFIRAKARQYYFTGKYYVKFKR